MLLVYFLNPLIFLITKFLFLDSPSVAGRLSRFMYRWIACLQYFFFCQKLTYACTIWIPLEEVNCNGIKYSFGIKCAKNSWICDAAYNRRTRLHARSISHQCERQRSTAAKRAYVYSCLPVVTGPSSWCLAKVNNVVVVFMLSPRSRYRRCCDRPRCFNIIAHRAEGAIGIRENGYFRDFAQQTFYERIAKKLRRKEESSRRRKTQILHPHVRGSISQHRAARRLNRARLAGKRIKRTRRGVAIVIGYLERVS